MTPRSGGGTMEVTRAMTKCEDGAALNGDALSDGLGFCPKCRENVRSVANGCCPVCFNHLLMPCICMSALAKADTPEERKRLIWERMKANGCTRESEIRFRQHCQVVGFVLPDEAGKANPLGKNTQGRSNARMLSDAARNEFRQTKISESNVG